MTKAEENYWIFQITTSDCAGALTSIAATFSNEGVNILAVAGHGARSDHKGLIEVSFESDDQTKDVLVRKIKRLTKVVGIKEEKTSPKKPSKLHLHSIMSFIFKGK